MSFIVRQLTVFLILFTSSIELLQAQSLTVIAAKGSIKSKKTGKVLRAGDNLNRDDLLTFKTAEDMLSVLTPDAKREVVKYPLKKFKKKEAQYVVSNILLDAPAATTLPITPDFINVEEAKAYFSTKPFLFLGSDTRLKLNKKLFPMSKALFFYMNYDYKEDNIDKKMEYKGDTLIFAKRVLFKIDGKEVDGKFGENFKFYYYNQPKNKHTFLGKMQPFFAVDERFKEETDVVVKAQQKLNASPEVIYKEVAGFIAQHYGTVMGSDYFQWMREQYPAIQYSPPPDEPRPVPVAPIPPQAGKQP